MEHVIAELYDCDIAISQEYATNILEGFADRGFIQIYREYEESMTESVKFLLC